MMGFPGRGRKNIPDADRMGFPGGGRKNTPAEDMMGFPGRGRTDIHAFPGRDRTSNLPSGRPKSFRSRKSQQEK